MRIRALLTATALAIAWHLAPAAAAGITPVPCGNQTWEPVAPTFDALPGAKAYFGKYDGGLYHIEIPDKWNGELVLSAHGLVTAGPELFDYFTAVSAAVEVVSGVKFESGKTREAGAQMNEIFGELHRQTARDGPHRNRPERRSASLRRRRIPSAVTTNKNYKYDIDGVRVKQPDMTYRASSGPYAELVPFDGKIDRPLLTMHGTGDLFVPIHLERTLNRAVDEAGKQDLLVQRIYRIAGHCRFNADEEARVRRPRSLGPRRPEAGRRQHHGRPARRG